MGEKAAIGLGGNAASSVGAPENTLRVALSRLKSDSVRVLAVSRFYRSAAFPEGSGPGYVNAAAIVESDLPPDALLSHLMQVEGSLGRVRRARWGPRTIDLDILLMGDHVTPDRITYDHWRNMPQAVQETETPEGLILPHPRLQERAFVLVPLSDIAGAWVHPVSGMTVSQMCAALPDAATAGITVI